MTISKSLRLIAHCLVLSAVLVVTHYASLITASAQTGSATLSGTVADEKGAVIAGAQVTVTNSATGLKREATTDGGGFFAFPLLQPATYSVRAQQTNFAPLEISNVVLNVGDRKALQIQLKAGDIKEAVTVESDTLTINQTDGSVSTVVDQNYVKNMPLNGRSFQDLILLTPGVVTNSPQASSTLGFSGEFSVNGQRTESNNYSVDGVSGNVGVTSGLTVVNGAGLSGSVAASTALGTTQALVSVDDLQEFRVQSSTYSAEYGRNPGGQFAFETKSGSNQWHGTGYDFFRNDYFDATDWFNNYFGVKKPALRQNDFGGTFGGPLYLPRFGEGGRSVYKRKNRTFFFFNYEGLRLLQPQAAAASFVPDAALRLSAPPALQPVLNAFPVQSPNGIDDTVNGVAQFIGTWSNPASLNSTSVRFDHDIKNKLTLFFRFSDTNSRSSVLGTVTQGLTPATNKISPYSMRTYTAGASTVLSSRVSNEFRLNFSSNGVRTTQTTSAIGGNTPVDLSQLAGVGPDGQVAVVLFLGANNIQLVQSGVLGQQRQWNLVDTASLSLGRHQFKFGVDYRRLEPIATQTKPQVAYQFFSKADIQANSPTLVFLARAASYPLYTNFSAFAQDEWKVSQRLSLSLGLRWEVNPPPGVTQGLMPYTVQGSSLATLTLAPQGTPLWQTTWFNFAPRLGLAYVLRNIPGRETVMRGGGGVFFDTGQQLGSLGFSGPGFTSGFTVISPASFPTPVVAPPIVNPPVPPFSFVDGFSSHLQLPYTLQWNASIEQALGKSQTLTVSYVGAHASRLLQENKFSAPTNPISHSFTIVQNGLTSDYHSLQAQFRRRFSRGLTALASYIWSHCIDYGSQNIFLAYQRGNCDFDVRHNLSAAFSYDLPDVGHSSFLNAVLHHWGLDDRFTARTGFPVTLDGRTLVQPDGQQFHAGLNFVSGQPVYLYGANCDSVLQGLGNLRPGQGCPGGRAINPLAFANVSSGLGSAPRNFARAFGAWQMDLAIRREFPIYEGLKLQFRAEAFNIFNHPNFGRINPNFGQPTFGQATATLANSLGVLGPLYQMGGPRSMQFALKLIF
jgi:Carboxypeptidase regulatory-like domain/TonB dependent receptor-like, beta-barrel